MGRLEASFLPYHPWVAFEASSRASSEACREEPSLVVRAWDIQVAFLELRGPLVERIPLAGEHPLERQGAFPLVGLVEDSSLLVVVLGNLAFIFMFLIILVNKIYQIKI